MPSQVQGTMNCYKCNYDNLSDAVSCQQCGAPMRQQPQKVLVLRRLQSRANNLPRREFAGYYVGYVLCGLVGGLVVAVVAFLLFLFVCDCLGVTDPAGSSGAVLVLLVFEIGVLSAYGVLAVREGKARISKARHHLPWYRRDPGARR
jgi:hypothetical protein